MAKFSRYDPRNKKSGKHKHQAKDGSTFKRIKHPVKKGKANYESKIIRAQGE